MITDFNQIDTDTEEGKLLYAAIIKIKNEYQWDDGTHLIIRQINEIKNSVFIEELVAKK